MKKILQIVAAASFSVLAFTTTASAAEPVCVIETTGPQSVNVCTNTRSVDCTIENDNIINIGNTSYQVSESGEATVVNNTSGGDVGSGNAGNNSSTSFNITVTNKDEGNCEFTTTTRTPIETSTAPTAPTAQGEGGIGGSAPVAQLPRTSGTSPLVLIGGALAGVSLIAAVTRGIVAFQRSRN